MCNRENRQVIRSGYLRNDVPGPSCEYRFAVPPGSFGEKWGNEALESSLIGEAAFLLMFFEVVGMLVLTLIVNKLFSMT